MATHWGSIRLCELNVEDLSLPSAIFSPTTNLSPKSSKNWGRHCSIFWKIWTWVPQSDSAFCSTSLIVVVAASNSTHSNGLWGFNLILHIIICRKLTQFAWHHSLNARWRVGGLTWPSRHFLWFYQLLKLCLQIEQDRWPQQAIKWL